MKQPVNFSLYLLALGFLLALILKFYEMSCWYSETKTSWTKRFLEVFSNFKSTMNLRALPNTLNRVGPMNTPSKSSLMFANMSKIQKWQHFLRRKFQETENSYYPIIDDLTQKLADLELHTRSGNLKFPDFDIHQFSFIKDWQNGDKSSRQVYSILKTMNMQSVAEAQLTRRLDHYMHNRENTVIGDYVKPCKELILAKSVPLYFKYLDMLVRYFEKLVEIDQAQEKVTWIEQMHNNDGTIAKKIEDLPLNQVIRQLDYQVIPFNGSRYYVGENIIVLDEEMAKGAYAIHWLFAPKGYIDELKRRFKVKDYMDIEQESAYIQRLIGAYVNGKV